MITEALQLVVTRIRAALNEGGGPPLVTLGDPPTGDTEGNARLVVSLIKSDRDVTVPEPRLKPTPEALKAPLRLNLDIMVAAFGGEYMARLALVEAAMRALHFARDNVIGAEDDPKRPVGRLSIELQSTEIQTSSYIWSTFQARISPHAIYRLRGVQIVDPADPVPFSVIEEIDIDVIPILQRDDE